MPSSRQRLPAGATINVEIATAYLSSDDAWYGKLTLP
jgi:hypothetical protein